MPLAVDQGVGLLVWSPLGWGRLTGKIDRKHPSPPSLSRLHATADLGPPVEDHYLFDVVDALQEVAKQTGKTVPLLGPRGRLYMIAQCRKAWVNCHRHRALKARHYKLKGSPATPRVVLRL